MHEIDNFQWFLLGPFMCNLLTQHHSHSRSNALTKEQHLKQVKFHLVFIWNLKIQMRRILSFSPVLCFGRNFKQYKLLCAQLIERQSESFLFVVQPCILLCNLKKKTSKKLIFSSFFSV